MSQYKGGTLLKNPAFKHILSIGYEFETHDLAKLSLSDDGTTLINSDATLRTLNYGIKTKRIVKLDSHNYKMSVAALPPTSGGGAPAPAPAPAPLAADTYVEYMEEVDMDGKTPNPSVILHITNDIAEGDFSDMLQESCGKYENKVKKNDMFYFIPSAAAAGASPLPVYKINFTGILTTEQACGSLSGTEWIVTYYNTHQNNNIIMETYVDACQRILSHLSDLENIPGNLVLRGNRPQLRSNETVLGVIEPRLLYHKPHTNLYYLYTGDDSYTMTQKYSLDKNTFIKPQMTFRVNIKHVILVMKEIMNHMNAGFKMAAYRKQNFKKEYNMIVKIEDCVNELCRSRAAMTDKIKNYLFMILYKLAIYVDDYSLTDSTESGNYFKNYLLFSARNTNDVYYNRMKELLTETMGSAEAAAEAIMDLVNQPKIIGKYMYKRKDVRAALMENNPPDTEYGNPIVSYKSYFEFFETPYMEEESTEDLKYDWLVYKKIDGIYSAQIDLVDDNLLIENRYFATELETYMKSLSMPKINIYNMKKFVAATLKDGTVADIQQKIYNKKTRRMMKKCTANQTRVSGRCRRHHPKVV